MTDAAPLMDDQFRRSLRRVVDHFWSDALEDYAGQPDHIFEALAVLMGYLDGTARGAQDYVRDLEKGSSWGDIGGSRLKDKEKVQNTPWRIERGLWRVLIVTSVVLVLGLAILSWIFPEMARIPTGDPDFYIVRISWWRTAFRFLWFSAGGLGLIWISFYTLRWIVRGFRERTK